MQDKPRKKAQPRRPYVKPEVKQVPLKTEEAVLGYCKPSSGSGPLGTCVTSCPVQAVKSQGAMNSLPRFSLKIAGLIIHLTADDPGMKIGVEKEMEKFLTPEGKPDIRVRAAWGDLSKKVWDNKIFDSGALWKMYHENDSCLFRFALSALDPFPYKVASFNQEFTSGEVLLNPSYFTRDQPVYPLEYPLDELLITHLLAMGRGVEVHACGLVDSQGNGYLFLGQSETGKSTMAKLWEKEEGVKILSDDRIILRQGDERFWIYGTPWHGEAGRACPAWAPLAKVYFLRHGQRNELLPMGRAEAVARFFSCSFVPFYSPAGIDFTLGLFEEVVKAAPCYELRFLPDERVIEFLRLTLPLSPKLGERAG